VPLLVVRPEPLTVPTIKAELALIDELPPRVRAPVPAALTQSEHPLNVSAGLPDRLIPVSLWVSSASTQAGPVWPGFASATERTAIVGSLDMNSPDKSRGCDWLMRISIASLSVVWLPEPGGLLTVTPLAKPKFAAT
jgi:hypothetical protein